MASTNRSATTGAKRLFISLRSLGYDVFVGVPCSFLAPLYDVLNDEHAEYYPATREDLAIGFAAGLYLAGKQPVVLMQNSGFASSVNALMSLIRTYEMPLLLIVSWRGHVGDSVEHHLMGGVTRSLIDLLEIPVAELVAMQELPAQFHSTKRPVALVVHKDDLL